MKIRTKLIVANLLIVLLLLGSLVYIFMKRSQDLVYDNILENNALSLSQISSNLDSKLTSYEEIANTLFLNSYLDEVVDTTYEDSIQAYDTYFLSYQPFVTAVQTTKDIYHLYLYADNPTFVFANVFLIDKEIRESDWYKKAMTSQAGGFWTGPYKNLADKELLFSFRKRMNNFDAESPRVLSVEIRLRVLSDLISEESKARRFLFTLADGTVLLDTSADRPVERLNQLPAAVSERVKTGESGNFVYEGDEETYQVVFKTLRSHNAVNGMKVVSYIPLSDIMPEIDQLKVLAVVLFLLAFAFAIILLSIITVGFTRRLSALSLKMKRVHKDNYEGFVEVKGKDEVAQLGEIFNRMVGRLGELIREVYQAEIDSREQELRTKEVELYALQTQINPHFLFNVLNMIRGKLLISGDRENAKVVGLLAKSFRMMLKKGGQTITLAEELEFVGTYLQIQQYRFGDKLTFDIDVPREMGALQIPKLSIQPLVENTVSHGIELDASPSHIRIRGEAVDGRQRITVEDDGLGMTEERIEEVRRWLTDEDSLSQEAHIGLRNVHRRIRQLYGPDCGLEINSEEGRGTQVTIWLPAKPARRTKEE
ncbi:histidine kinase [Cohnella yongneupensis]|uniref:Histidine kinase n=1 Tax=Cohnella yongneupensis TaxID=425006 RepID=A0ABW0R4I8_9BACL